jgi:hypothetical protein
VIDTERHPRSPVGVFRLAAVTSLMGIWTLALSRLLLVAAVVLTVQYALLGLYSLAAMFGFTLLVYAYLIYFGDRPIERRLLGRPGPPEPPEK